MTTAPRPMQGHHAYTAGFIVPGVLCTALLALHLTPAALALTLAFTAALLGVLRAKGAVLAAISVLLILTVPHTPTPNAALLTECLAVYTWAVAVSLCFVRPRGTNTAEPCCTYGEAGGPQR